MFDDTDELPPMTPEHAAALAAELDRLVNDALANLWEIAGILETGIDPRPHGASVHLIVEALKDVVRVAGVTGPADWDAALQNLI